ncbi:dTDP-4-dehydrorhamnose 3,5-epimerase [Thiorhodovibrio litoralis]|uniref:dTDP-4-dehydrorhamnose 3,5-epimerase n=1 Tax=Thiorhodovibrio litoralis TaxID=2952932 RepID=UPI002B259DE8|nr:dTDP-4-dehydrorhamnose 3,5-epimerase [Thiorhodovibrio litoralis]WPL10440.1 dTDP-4-dehydrorhamnose 3,5-epimerase [Thiorhodovibrio litoralis]
MKLIETMLPDCYELQPRVLSDVRGCFVKTFQQNWFEDLGLSTHWAEQYYSVSQHGVLRGLHFQLPPHDHAKLVYCAAGEVMDVALDLRKGSPTLGQHICLTLNAAKGNMIYLAPGLAHGFFTLSESATLIYNVTSVYVPSHDTGIRWDSFGVPWPEQDPQMSDRDRGFVSLNCFDSPFYFPSTATQSTK